MRKLIVSMNVTIDGFMSGPDCELDWHFKCWTKEMGEALCTQLSQADTILLGRVTYQAMAKYWPSKITDTNVRGEDFAFAEMMNQYDKIVFTNTLREAEWSKSKLMNENVEDEIKKLKNQRGRNMIVYGSGKLVKALMYYNLVDEYQLWVHPVILGKGKQLFNNPHEWLDMKLCECETFSSGVILLHYQTIKINENGNNKKTKRRILRGQF